VAEDATEHAAADTEEDEDDVVEEVVVDAVVCLEQDELARARGVQLLQRRSRNEGAEERPPQNATRKIGADFLVAEEHAANGRAKGNGQARGAGHAECLAHLAFVGSVLGNALGHQVSDAGRDVDERAFFPQAHARGHGKGGTDCLDDEDLEI